MAPKKNSMFYPNMNVMRYLLSFGILINHFNVLGGHNVSNSVNGALWTMKVERMLDLSVPIFVWILCRTKFKKEHLAIAIIICSMICHLTFDSLYESSGRAIY